MAIDKENTPIVSVKQCVMAPIYIAICVARFSLTVLCDRYAYIYSYIYA